MMKAFAIQKVKDQSSIVTRDTIHIMRDVLDCDQLGNLINCLETKGHKWAIFEGVQGILNALNSERVKLLFIGVSDGKAADFVGAIRAADRSAEDIPILGYLKQHLSDVEQDLIIPELDDFLLEPLSLYDLSFRVRRLLQRANERHEGVKPIYQMGMRQFIGQAPSFLAIVEKIPRLAACDAPVLLIGNTGTGKEMCARAIHHLSPRSNRPFIPVNCGAIPAELFENEMFGHEPGAFTDARQTRRGLIAEAEGGTLLLDEVDSLPLLAQVKLLRFLEDREYRPLGGFNYRRADTRVLAACNQDLQRKVQEGDFREDLYYRLKVLSVVLPALQDRREDILPLALYFLKQAAGEYKTQITGFSPNAIQKLMFYSWPGNVRELENVVRQAAVLADGPLIRAHQLQLHDLRPVGGRFEGFKATKAGVIESFERTYLSEILAACGGNISQAAREAKMDRRAFFALLKKHHLTSTHWKRLKLRQS